MGNEEQQKEYATRNKALKGIGLHQKKSTLSISDYQYHSNDLSQQQLDTLLTLFPTQTPLQYDAFEGTYQT
ncbi:MAG: hypothetical protein ACMXYC_04140 [Candidatus Woesearchaeota archaeon]